ncbi:MAG: disulfide bond formation protein B [bacterium]|nr:disulfide bond formation protein B [bacterium]
MNVETIHYLNVFLGSGAIVLQILSVVALFLLFIGPKKNSYLNFIDQHYLNLGFLIALSASLFSLVYSEIIGFTPCYLCWYQRVFSFPLAFIFGVAIWSKDRKIVKYVLPLLSVGFVVSVYQNFIYYFNSNASNLPCDASGASCYQQLVSEFGGYISIPMLALTTFIALTTIVLVAHFYKKED